MKITFKKLAIATSLCSALVLSPVSFADCDGSGHHKGMHKSEQTSEKRLAKLAKKLDLTEAQQAQIQVIQADNKAQQEALKPAMKAFREQVKALESAETFDEQAFIALHASNQDMFSAKALLRVKHMFAMKSVLTEEQLVKFEKMKKKKSRRSHK